MPCLRESRLSRHARVNCTTESRYWGKRTAGRASRHVKDGIWKRRTKNYAGQRSFRLYFGHDASAAPGQQLLLLALAARLADLAANRFALIANSFALIGFRFTEFANFSGGLPHALFVNSGNGDDRISRLGIHGD